MSAITPENEVSIQDLREGRFLEVVSREPDGLGALPRLFNILELEQDRVPLNSILAEGMLGHVVSGVNIRPDVGQVAQTIIDLAALRPYHVGIDIAMTLRAIAFKVGINLTGMDDTAGYTFELMEALGDHAQTYFPIASRRSEF